MRGFDDRTGYASQDTQTLAQNQGTECLCAPGALAYKESYMERLGGLDPELFEQELPATTCDTPTPAAATCVTQSRQPTLSQDSAVEWGGLFMLKAQRTYHWTFRAYSEVGGGLASYPDPGIDVFVAQAPDLSAAAAAADAALSAVDDNTTQVRAAGQLSIKAATLQQAQHIIFTDTAGGVNSTTVVLRVEQDGPVAVLTQHVPSEFMAYFLVDAESGEHLFPSSPTLYGSRAALPSAAVALSAASAILRLLLAFSTAAVISANSAYF